MNQPLKQSSETLELQKILKMLADKCSNEKSKTAALELAPSCDYSDVCAELEKTSDAFDLAVRFGTPVFYNFKDVTAAVTMAKSGSRLSLRDFLDTALLLSQVNGLREWFSQCETTAKSLEYKFSTLAPNSYLKKKIDDTVISENEISDNASPQLAAIRKRKQRAQRQLRETLDKLVKSKAKYLQDEIVTIRDGRYVIPVKSEHRGDVQGLIHDTSSSGQTYFIEPMSVVESNNDIRLLENQEAEEIDRILTELSADCGDFAEELALNFKLCAELNLYFAKANLGAEMRGAIPKMAGEPVLELVSARHPLLGQKAVAENISLGDGCKSLIITGSNMGGKTVALKTAGLLPLMAMCGLMIPASENSRLGVFSQVFASIGDSQSIEQNLSTFSAHTLGVIDILEKADRRSLVLIDELGGGTDPVEGAALAVAVTEELRRRGALTIITTHYQELKLYALETDGAENASFEFNLDTLTPTYRLLTGSPGKSNAFAISKSLGMPESIISYAENLLTSETKRLDDVIERLENTRSEYEEKLRETEKLRRKAEEQAKEFEEKLNNLNERQEKELDDARKRAQNIIDGVKAKSNELMSELEQIRKEQNREKFAERVSDADKRIGGAIGEMNEITKPEQNSAKKNPYSPPYDPKNGDDVLVIDINRQGVVISDTSNGKVFVQVGSMRMKCPVSNLRFVPKNVESKRKNTKINPYVNQKGERISAVSRTAQAEIDLRGMSADDGVHEMEMFINDAVLAGRQNVCVIHGRGTGVLRSACQKRLRELKAVKSFRLGVYGEGEDGVTIVNL